jgi:hypothetical protein
MASEGVHTQRSYNYVARPFDRDFSYLCRWPTSSKKQETNSAPSCSSWCLNENLKGSEVRSRCARSYVRRGGVGYVKAMLDGEA